MIGVLYSVVTSVTSTLWTDPCISFPCASRARCSGNSTTGSFDCVCNPGFTGNPFSFCSGKEHKQLVTTGYVIAFSSPLSCKVHLDTIHGW